MLYVLGVQMYIYLALIKHKHRYNLYFNDEMRLVII